MMKFLKENKWLIGVVIALIAIYMVDYSKGVKATKITLNNFKNVGLMLPPIFILIGLLDTWVPKEMMVKFMGKKSGVLGAFLALTLGAVGAGPLYVAFPIAAILIKKGARYAYVFLFLSAWVSIKLPIFMYEWTSFGAKFTLIHVASSLTVYIIGSFLMERLLSSDTKEMMEERAETLSA